MKVEYTRLTPVDLAQVQKTLPVNVTSDTSGMVALDEDGTLLAALVAQDWTPTCVQVHQVIYKTMVLRHSWLEEVANYIFTQAGRLKMLGLVAADNAQALSLNHKIGFTELVRIEDGYDVGVDYVLMELKRENCPFWITADLRAA